MSAEEQVGLFETKTTRRFRRFDRDNPRVWQLFVRFTSDVIARGFRHFSADAVLHRIRWETSVETHGAGFADGRVLKISNDFAAYYARKFHRAYPEHDGLFRTRGSQADELYGELLCDSTN